MRMPCKDAGKCSIIAITTITTIITISTSIRVIAIILLLLYTSSVLGQGLHVFFDDSPLV